MKFAPFHLLPLILLELSLVTARAEPPDQNAPVLQPRDDTREPFISFSGRPLCSKWTCGSIEDGGNSTTGGANNGTANSTGLVCPNDPVERRDVHLYARTFQPMEGKGAVERLARKRKMNTDLSGPEQWISDFIPFDGKQAKSATIVGMIGCAAVAAMSDQGMMIAHLWESGEDRSGNPDLENTLHPDFYQETVNTAKEAFAKQKRKLNGGQVLVMLPTDQEGDFLYENEEYPQLNKNGKFSKTKKKKGTGISQAIQDMASDITGTEPKVAKYKVPKNDREMAKLARNKDPRGAFAMQYDPKNAKGDRPNARQIWVENQEQFELTNFGLQRK